MADKEAKQTRSPAATILTAVVAFLSGGFAGAVFTWYVNRPDVTVVTYNVSTTALGSSEAASVVPNLKIQLGSENITSLYTHTIDLIVPKGPFVDQADFAVTLPAGTHIYGTRTVSPNSVQGITCTPITDGLKCRIGPLSANMAKPFRVIVASDRGEQPGVELTAKNLELLSNREYLDRGKSPWWNWLIALLAGLAAGEGGWRIVHKISDRTSRQP